jgi:hypothetical protein
MHVMHMAIEEHDIKRIALTQLETALRLYFERQDYYSVVALAGAADVIFGGLLEASGLDSSLKTIKESVVVMHQHMTGITITEKNVADLANLTRNALKHWSAGQPPVVSFDVIEEAQDMLNRAIDNYWALEQQLSPAMEQFQRELHSG